MADHQGAPHGHHHPHGHHAPVEKSELKTGLVGFAIAWVMLLIIMGVAHFLAL